jgi:hypothetical protein
VEQDETGEQGQGRERARPHHEGQIGTMKGLFREPLQNAPIPDGGSPSFRLFRDNAAHNRRARGAAGGPRQGVPARRCLATDPGPSRGPGGGPGPAKRQRGSDGGGRRTSAPVEQIGRRRPERRRHGREHRRWVRILRMTTGSSIVATTLHAAATAGTGQYVHREGVPHQLRRRPLPRRGRRERLHGRGGGRLSTRHRRRRQRFALLSSKCDQGSRCEAPLGSGPPADHGALGGTGGAAMPLWTAASGPTGSGVSRP